jgi:F-type H+-transporting ATPase subunit b
MLKIDVTFLYVIVVFLLTSGILKRYLFGPLAAILEARQTEALAAQKSHAESLAALSRTVAEAEEKLSTARREALKVREGLRGEGAARLSQRLEEARVASEAAVAQAVKRIESEAAASSKKLPGEAATLARTLAEKILGRRLAS